MPERSSPFRWIATGALIVGVLDLLDAFVFFGLRGAGPVRILQGIAAGILGRDAAIAGGLPTAALGLLLHFVIATGIVTVAVLAARWAPLLVAWPWLAGPVYGLAVYLVMNRVIVPLSAAGGSGAPRPAAVVINGLLIHVLGVGVPAVLAARRSIAAPPPAPQ